MYGVFDSDGAMLMCKDTEEAARAWASMFEGDTGHHVEVRMI